MTESALELLKNRIDITRVPFTERGSRILVMQRNSALVLRLAERWFKMDKRLSAYRQRPPIIDDLIFTDGDSAALHFTCDTYPDRLEFHTALGEFALTFVDTETLLLRLPSAACGLTFTAHMNQGQTDRRGGTLGILSDIRRNMAYTTNRRLRLNQIEAQTSDHMLVRLQMEPGPEAGLLLNLTPRLGFNRYLPDTAQAFAAARRRWLDWFSAAPALSGPYEGLYEYAWWVMRAGLISTRFFITRESMTPSKLHYVGVWQWDAYFHALAYRHVNMQLARDQLRVMIDHQRADGMIPDAVHDEGTITHLSFPVDADVTKPPLLAWAAWKLYETDGDREFLEEIYEPIARWNSWWIEANDTDDDGLCEYLHPFSSGLDDSPLWDAGMPVTAPDLNTYLVLQMEALARIAAVLELPKEAARWEQKAQAHLERMVAHLWDEKAGCFWALQNGRPIHVFTPFNLLPLITGRLPEAITRRLTAHLSNPDSFWTRYPLPTVARNDPAYQPEEMWRGPTWININYLMIEGLLRSGYPELARELRQRTLEMAANHADIYEYYHPETGQPGPKAAPMFGWSAALLIELLLQTPTE